MHPEDSIVLHRQFSKLVMPAPNKLCSHPGNRGKNSGGRDPLGESAASANWQLSTTHAESSRQTQESPPPKEDEADGDSRISEFRGYGSAPIGQRSNKSAIHHNDIELRLGFDLQLKHMSLESLVSPITVHSGQKTSSSTPRKSDTRTTCAQHLHMQPPGLEGPGG